MKQSTAAGERHVDTHSNGRPHHADKAAQQPHVHAGSVSQGARPAMDDVHTGAAAGDKPGDRGSASAAEHAKLLEQGMSGMPALLAMIGISLTILLAALDQTIVGTALPRIVAELHGFDLYAWVAT